MSRESREQADGFYDCELEEYHVYDCSLCDRYHVVHDDATAFFCPQKQLKEEPAGIVIIPTINKISSS